MQLNCLYVILPAKLDGKTVGPQCFAGPIDKLLTPCENLTIVKIEPTAIFNLDIEPTDLSTDQMYLYKIYRLVSSGMVPESLAKRHPGNISHARWLTTADRLLRLYVATGSRDESLIILVNFTLKMYAEMWFRKKCIPQAQNGLVNLILILNAMRDFDDSRISFVVIIIAYPSFLSRKKKIIFFCIFLWSGASRYCASDLNFCNNVQNSAFLWTSLNAVPGNTCCNV